MKITSKNPLVNNLEMSMLAAAYQAGVTAIKVRNNERFLNGKKIMIGSPGYERTEIVTINGAITAGQNLTITATKFAHDADDPVYVLKYNQMKFYKSTTGSGGSYSELSGSPVDLDVDNANLSTTFDDTTGLSTYYYKISFYDSVTPAESELSDPIPGSGFPRNSVGKLVSNFFSEVNDTNQQHMSVVDCLSIINEVNEDLITQSNRPYRFLLTEATLDTVAGANEIDLPTDYWKFKRLKYNYDDGIEDRTDLYRVITIDEMDYVAYNNLADRSDGLQYLALDDVEDAIKLFPTPLTSQADKITLTYYKTFDDITSMSQQLETPNSRIYKMFLMARYYRQRSTKEPSFVGIADRYTNDYTSEVVKLQRSNRKDVGSPTGMRPDTRTSRGLRRN